MARKYAEQQFNRISPEVQASSRGWGPPGGTLGRILSATAPRVAALRARRPALEAAARRAPDPPRLSAALRREDVAIVAEVKRRSPSRGAINSALSLGAQTSAYVAGGAAAISILTETVHFGGAPEELAEAARCVDVPLLKKDFHVDPIQAVEARALGASALLLIARALTPAELPTMLRATHDQGLEALVEVRDEWEIERALEAGATLVGINNRNLETLEIDPTTAERLVSLLPLDRVAIAESGINGVDDVRRAGAAGADAVLVGSMLSAAPDPTAAVRDLRGIPSARAQRRR